ncbi:hypothetical protein [Acidipila rosea]|uniref:Uncharacterized protein n=1 Tax=Acidipila rosea TaxID=768535 RepID=A0A4R1L1X8_9BACT|nr:hypothetical protein [Acidipila rosea]TCK71982.1 hypothetical protein C7378_2606 [Acidipila rosea]
MRIEASEEMLMDSVERLNAAVGLLEKTVLWMEEREASMTGEVKKISAAIESERPRIEEELRQKLEAAEQQIAELKAQAAAPAARAVSARQTIPSTTAQLLAKQGISTLDSVEAGALDAALNGLSIEQRIAVKSQLMRAGVLV